MPPFDVSSQAKVENLNVDLLDGLDSSAFSPVSHSHDDLYYTKGVADSRFLGLTAVAADAGLLDGLDSSAFVQTADLVMSTAVHASGNQDVLLNDGTMAIVRSVSLTPPADGTVIVGSTANVASSFGGVLVYCSITTGSTFDAEHEQGWQSGETDGRWAQLAGTRGFDVVGAEDFTANLVCTHVDVTHSGTSSQVIDSALTAIFIPNP
jgi:hypothetical protein